MLLSSPCLLRRWTHPNTLTLWPLLGSRWWILTWETQTAPPHLQLIQSKTSNRRTRATWFQTKIFKHLVFKLPNKVILVWKRLLVCSPKRFFEWFRNNKVFELLLLKSHSKLCVINAISNNSLIISMEKKSTFQKLNLYYLCFYIAVLLCFLYLLLFSWMTFVYDIVKYAKVLKTFQNVFISLHTILSCVTGYEC